ncbi:MAG TPA: hypothetical protein VME70_10365 [Mycobacteriales bacterium]|nr:hypothetical protein [Mycobacteriales bacterium]
MNSIGKWGTGAALAALALTAAACGSSSSGGSGGGGGGSTIAPGTNVAPASLQTHSTSLGKVLVDSKGLTIYELVGDTASNQKCDASCQAFWPPVMKGGSQVVINGHPAFTFTNDSAPGQTHGQGEKDTWGTWWALNASGNPITGSGTPAPAPSSSSSSSGGGGGYGY